MKEMTDQELTDKISQVFDNFEEPTAAHGWKELRKKYPESDQKPILLWWSAAAAIALIVAGLWFFPPELAPKPQEELVKARQSENPKGEINNIKPSELSDNALDRDKSDEPMQLSDPHKTASASQGKTGSQEGRSRVVPDVSPAVMPNISSNESTHHTLTSHSEESAVVNNSYQKQQILPLPKINESEKSDKVVNRDSLIEVTAKLLALSQNATNANVNQGLVKGTAYRSQKTTDKNRAFSFYAGSYFNYSLGSETKLNFGAGFTSDIKLASNLKLSTGLGLANNSLRYNDGVPSRGREKVAADPLFTSIGVGAPSNNTLTTITRYDAALLGLDIPVNLKYLIIPRDNKLYLLAGLSSGTYLSETYSAAYMLYNTNGLTNPPNNVQEKKQLKSFDLARTLNISFGYSADLGKNQNITVEPFLKYPLGGLGSEDLRFGSAGINLKMNFSQFTKR